MTASDLIKSHEGLMLRRKGKVEHICLMCGKLYFVFPSRSATSKYCSMECSKKAAVKTLRRVNKENDTKITVPCSRCGAPVTRRQAVIDKYTSRYCSTACKAAAYNKHVALKCTICGKEYERHPSDMKKTAGAGSFCSKKCRGQAMSEMQKGDRNPFWRGGVSPQNKLIRNGKMMMNWRKAVFERDNYTCKVCGKRGGQLHAHHIVEFHKDRLNFDVNNGLTAHARCHYEGLHGFSRTS